jgi:uncharacterized iron-regulated membrane protein
MNIRKVFNYLHLWLGLTSGLVIFIIALTGALWTFETEIQDALYSYRKVKQENIPYITPSQLKAIAAKVFDDKPVHSISYPAKDKAATVKSWSNEKENQYHFIAYINPYTGKLLHVKKNHNFFDVVIELHTNLLLGDAGRKIIDYSTLIFLLMIISGIVLWWPRSKARRKSSFSIKRNTSFKRKNYDLHNVLGFYACWVLIFIVLTGLAWGFEWMNKSLYAAASGGAVYKDWPAPKSDTINATNEITAIDDKVFTTAATAYNKPYESIEMYYPAVKDETYSVYINPSSKTYYKSSDYYFDAYTGSLLTEEHFAQKNGGEKIRSMYYDIHVGKILGFPGQLLVFFASLIAASLPVTGFLIWYGKRKKARKMKRTSFFTGGTAATPLATQ